MRPTSWGSYPPPLPQRVEYYYDQDPVLDTYIFLADQSTLFQVNPVVVAQHCFESHFVRGLQR